MADEENSIASLVDIQWVQPCSGGCVGVAHSLGTMSGQVQRGCGGLRVSRAGTAEFKFEFVVFTQCGQAQAHHKECR